MKKMVLRLLFVVISICSLFLIGSVSFAAPYNGEVFKFKQPDNTYVDVKIWGDEFYQRAESLDGYTLCYDPQTHWICYAKTDSGSNDFVSTGIAYRGTTGSEITLPNKQKLSKGLKLNINSIHKKARTKFNELYLGDTSGASTGANTSYAASTAYASTTASDIKGLTILIDFSDCPSTISKDEINNMINLPGYMGYNNNGSVRDYFNDISGGKLNYTNDVIGYYRASKTKSYYNDPSATGRAVELVTEALNNLKQSGYDFTKLSVNYNKMVLAVNIMYAGTPDVDWSKGLWPHSGSISPFYANGVYISRYQMSSIGTTGLKIGTFAHENGHMICNYPDLYDYQDDSRGVGYYCIMSANGTTNPQPPCPYLRNVISGWGTITDLNGYPNNSQITVKSNSLDVYRYKNPNNLNEFFLIESVQKKGRWSIMPDEGLLIWHIDKKGSNDYQDMTYTKHYMVSVEQADGMFDLEKKLNYGGANDLFHYGNIDKFNSSTVPNSNWWDGTSSGFSISNISNIGDTMTFVLQNGNTAPTYTPTLKPTPTPTSTPTATTRPTYTPTFSPTPTSTSTPTPTIPSYKVSGYLKLDFSTNNTDALSGFKVELSGTDNYTVSDTTGYFEISGVQQNQSEYTIIISKPGFLTRTLPGITVTKDTVIGSLSAPFEMWGGDFNKDNAINMFDLIELAKSFNSLSGDGKYDSLYDLNLDNAVNMTDAMNVGKHFNEIPSHYSMPQIS